MKFPSLPAASTLDGTEVSPLTQGGVDKRTTAQAIANLFKGTKGADIASAGTTSIGAATGNYVNITGTTTITSLGTGTAGWLRFVRFAGALTLTHNATSLILPTSANIVTAANDVAIFVSEGSSNWRCLGYLRANGMPLAADTDGTLAANSDAKLATQKAVKTYVDGIVAAQDAMVFKGVIDCSANPNYPAADRGWTYRVSVAGKIGGASGPNVQQGDMLICLTDGSASGDQATVGANWAIIQTNIDGALTTSDIGVTVQGINANVSALAGLTLAADKLLYATAVGTLALSDLTSFARTLLDDPDAATMLATLGAIAASTKGAASGVAPLNADARLDPIYRAKKRVTVAPVAGVLTLDLATLDDAYIALSANVTSTVVTNGPPAGYAREGTLVFVQDATGGRTWAPPAGAKWPNGLAAVLTATANAVDHIGYRVYNNAGSLEYTFYPVRDVR